jgi:hypothetical protein
MTLRRLTKQQGMAALEKARQERLAREAGGETSPLDEWPDGPPLGDDEAMNRYNAAFRQWHEEQRR